MEKGFCYAALQKLAVVTQSRVLFLSRYKKQITLSSFAAFDKGLGSEGCFEGCLIAEGLYLVNTIFRMFCFCLDFCHTKLCTEKHIFCQ